MAPRLDAVTTSLKLATAALLATQRADGSFNAAENMEPLATASQLVLDAFLGRLTDRDRAQGGMFLASLQNADGSFPAYPHAAGTLSSTALCWAALHAVGRAHGGSALVRARAWVMEHGGVDAVIARMFSHSDQNVVYLAMVGLADPEQLPDPQLWFSMVPPVLSLMQRKLNAGVLMGALSMGWVTRLLRARARRQRVDLLWGVHRLEAHATKRYLTQFQNTDGSWDGNTLQTGLYVAGLFAAGADVKHATRWLEQHKVYDDTGMHMCVFTCENWMTAFTVRALLRAGVPRSDVRVDRAVRFLVGSQARSEMSRIDQRKRGAARSGGWAFQADNASMPDSDDTGAVLSALGLALVRDDGAPLSNATTDAVSEAVARAAPQLLDMQAPQGGWSAFVWNLGSKPPGPLYTTPLALPRTALGKAKYFLDPPVEMADPPTEGLTGRVLYGLASVGYRNDAPPVKRAAQWLKAQRAPNGVWWGRWLVNYLAGTASVVSGLSACGEDLTQPWIADAIAWLISKQNADGGWGETPASYGDASLAGVGPSMPPLTAIVLSALLDAGKLTHDSVPRAVDYLLAQQGSDALWPNNAWMQVMIPPDQFYAYEGERMCRPIEALGQWQALTTATPTTRAPMQRLEVLTPTDALPFTSARVDAVWSRTSLIALRAFADPEADRVVTEVFARGDQRALGQVMAALVRSDDPIPQGLPPRAEAYFTQTQALPAWADPQQLAIAHALFEQHGWAVALGLFTSSLPQAYCAAKGARVLLQTQGMTRNVRRRVLETAQFVFDVMTPGGLDPAGRGIRAAQKVRLMHSTIRHLILIDGAWDSASWGVPINQEDLAGTLMTFSVVILDAFAAVGIALTAAQQTAYLHLWNVVGHFLGVAQPLLPRSVDDGQALMAAIREDQWQGSVAGQQLAQALVLTMDDYLPHVVADLPVALVRKVAGDRVCDLLALPRNDWTALVVREAGAVDAMLGKFAHKNSPGDAFLRACVTHMMQALIDVQRDDKQTTFRIPTQLLRGWSLSD